MKKLNLFSMLVAVVALLFASCSIDMEYPTSGEERVVTFSAQVPSAVGSRAAVLPGNAAEVKKMSYWVYKVEGSTWTYLPNLSGVKDVTTGEATTISLSLLKSLEYNVILWADAFGGQNSPYSYNPDTYELTMDFSKIVANNEKLDAFFGAKTIQENSGNQYHYITLSRPFAQLNFGTSDLDEVEANGITLQRTGIELECANVLNLNTGEVSGEHVREYTPTAIPVDYQFPYDSNGHDLISLNYILVGTESVTTAVTLNYTMDADDYTLSVNAPLQRNRRTNVYGGMLIGKNSLLSVSIRDSFHDNSNNVQEGWDPKEDPEEIVPPGGSGGSDPGEDPF